MRLYLQFGYGMMEHCQHLIERWGGGTVILSPRDLNATQLPKFSQEIKSLKNGHVLFDPQFYLPHADHERLCSHDFWPSDYETGAFWSGPELVQLIQKIILCNEQCGCRELILPGLLAEEVNDDWMAIQQAILEAANAESPSLPIIATIAMSADATRDEDQVAEVIASSEDWKCAGYYVVCQHPGDQYLVSDEAWLANVLSLVAGFRLRGKKVIVGYSNQQMLILAAAKTHAISSGTWLNVRAFSPDKFIVTEDTRRKSTWYYCPQALSEYKIPALDRAQARDKLRLMAPATRLDGGYAAALFSGAQPSSVNWPEQQAFRHYLFALRGQTRQAVKATFNDTIDWYNRSLDIAESLLVRLRAEGVNGEVRDFSPVIEASRAALQSLVNSQGPLLRRNWANL